MLAAALTHDGPVAIRYPKGPAPAGFDGSNGLNGINGLNGPNGLNDINGLKGLKEIKAEVLSGEGAPLQIWALGDQVPKALEIARLLGEKGLFAGVVNARLVKPVDVGLLQRQVAAGARIATLENGSITGGFGSAVQEAVPAANVVRLGWPDDFVPHGSIDQLESAFSLTAPQIAERLSESFNH